VFLPNIFLQSARTHSRGKRGFAFQAFAHGMVKEIVGHGVIILFILEQDVILRDVNFLQPELEILHAFLL
jgi:hypothetical protein